MAKNQSSPNEIKYFNVVIGGVDITSMVIQCDVFQEVFSPSWSATLVFMDTQNILMNIPVKAGTDVEVTMETDYPSNKRKTFKFKVGKISDRTQVKQETLGYVVNCISASQIENYKVRVSKAYSNMPPFAMVDNILSESGLGSLEDFTSDNAKHSVIVPNMSPFAAVAWISRFTKKAGADFWFYQSDDKKYKFKSYDQMLLDRSGVKFKQTNPNKYDDSGNVADEHFLNIEHFEFVTQHDSLNAHAGGYYGSTVVSHDIINKTFEETPFTYGDDLPDDLTNAPFDSGVFGGSEKSHIVYQPVHKGIVGGATPADTFRDWVSSRKSNVMKMEENRLIMTVPGAVSHYELLGKEVHVELPSHQDVDDAEFLEKYLKGSYVVTAVRHVVTAGFYKVIMELGKKKLENPYS